MSSKGEEQKRCLSEQLETLCGKKRMAGSCWKEGMRGWSSCVDVDEYVAAYGYVCIAGGGGADGDISHPQAVVTWHLHRKQGDKKYIDKLAGWGRMEEFGNV